jgi:tRNA modification GTPase
MVLVVLDSSNQLAAEDYELLETTKNRKTIVVANKADLGEPRLAGREGLKILKTSALTGEGIDQLRAAILDALSGHSPGEHEAGFLTNVRHQRLVEESLASLAAAQQAVEARIPHEMIMMDLYGALRPLDTITGETTTDDILNLIFSSFCIGK